MILVAEDDEPLRRLAARVLRNAGYDVLEAADGEEALTCALDHGHIDLLITDIAMPAMGGVELARRLSACDADMRVIYMSGYSEAAVSRHEELLADASWMTKPFTMAEFLRRVRNTLEATREAGACVTFQP